MFYALVAIYLSDVFYVLFKNISLVRRRWEKARQFPRETHDYPHVAERPSHLRPRLMYGIWIFWSVCTWEEYYFIPFAYLYNMQEPIWLQSSRLLFSAESFFQSWSKRTYCNHPWLGRCQKTFDRFVFELTKVYLVAVYRTINVAKVTWMEIFGHLCNMVVM